MAELLITRVGEDRIGLWVADVVEAVRAVAITPLPGIPATIEGIIDVRGEIVPVIDLRLRLGRRKRALAPSDRFVLVRTEHRKVALHVEATEAVAEVDAGLVSPTGGFGPRPTGISGVARLPDGLVLIHDMESFLSETEAALIEDALAARANEGDG